jgi:hypothetical protein
MTGAMVNDDATRLSGLQASANSPLPRCCRWCFDSFKARACLPGFCSGRPCHHLSSSDDRRTQPATVASSKVIAPTWPQHTHTRVQMGFTKQLCDITKKAKCGRRNIDLIRPRRPTCARGPCEQRPVHPCGHHRERGRHGACRQPRLRTPGAQCGEHQSRASSTCGTSRR